ncbi:hypothetical protein OESDEN_06291 [Oesophagostomum dentatum]|uniref:Uncharacterized protein n=1 Tax=Oesophagostomum dentatum TaxID=61180 RepID=A0A0B1TCF4_OESDE|nr:hypothetical protein OESDEN_06291 [Oesophagostomum dentatum]
MLEDDPCLDAMQVETLESVELLPRYSHLQRPWLRPGITPKIFTSDGLRYQWMWAKSLAVRGLGHGITIDDLLRFLDGQNCSFLAVGDAVWQSVQRSRPIRIEGEISCPMKELYTICLDKYGASACNLFPSEIPGPTMYRLEIGDARANKSLDELKAEPLVLYEWGSMLSLSAPRWGYTVTTMAIHDNNAGQVAAQTFYCESVLNGVISWAGDDLTTTCHLVYPRVSDRKRIAAARELLSSEMGSHWSNVMGPAIDEMEAVYLTEKQFVDVRNRLKGRVSGGKKLSFFAKEQQYGVGGHYTGVLRDGEPLVNDMAEVHRRPIMSKTETVSELPKDVEEIPEVESSEESEADSPPGAGFNDPVSSTEDAHIPKRDIAKVSNLEHQHDVSTTVSTKEEFVQTGATTTPSPTSELPQKNALDSDPAPQQSSSGSVFTLCLNSVILLLLAVSLELQPL